MTIFIYKISFPNNSKVYIGKTNNPKRRFRDHISYTKKGWRSHLHCAMRLYGIENTIFEVIATCLEDSRACGDHCEKLIIKQYDSFKHGYNMTAGGDGGPGLSGDKNPNYGKKTKGFAGRKHTKESNQLNREKNSGENSPCIRLRKKYRFTHLNADGSIWIDECLGLQKYGRDNSYQASNLSRVQSGKIKSHRDIIKVELI